MVYTSLIVNLFTLHHSAFHASFAQSNTNPIPTDLMSQFHPFAVKL